MAAVAVLAHHAGLAADGFTTQSHGHWLDAGAFGVDFFFVLSGFIIYHVHHGDPRTVAAARSFLGRRLRRIHVPYQPVSLALIGAYCLLPGLSQADRPWGLFTSLTLLPSNAPPALSVAWTLVLEMVFYLVFLLFYLTRHFWPCVAAWAALAVGLATAGRVTGIDRAAIPLVFDPLTLEFVAGMVAARAFAGMPARLWPPSPPRPTRRGCCWVSPLRHWSSAPR